MVFQTLTKLSTQLKLPRKFRIHGRSMQSDQRINSYRSWSPAEEISRWPIALIVPKTLVKKIKDALEATESLNKNVKIRPARPEEQKASLRGPSVEPRPDAFLIFTKLSVGTEQVSPDTLPVKEDVLQSLGLVELEADIGMIVLKQDHDNHGVLMSERGCKDSPSSHEASTRETSSMNPLARTVAYWLHQLPEEEPQRVFSRDVVLCYSWTYMIYPPLLLLPPTTLSNLSSIFVLKGQTLPKDLSSLWSLLSKESKTSHIALNAPIGASASTEASDQGGGYTEANILRSPMGLAPLYGDFGPDLPLYHVPNITDFHSAFWCTAQQNGIFQTWAPRYTMFSRGNISEKARILKLQTVTEGRLGSQPEEMSAVDLYAGIGYLAFSYAKARVGKVLCWEINPWSVEGLRRGATKNRWGVQVIKDGQAANEAINEEERLIVFQESNEHAARRIAAIRNSFPPIRHVNCGLLPFSKNSWEAAVQVLDPTTGGWIHAHENIAKRDIERRTKEVVSIFNRLVMKDCVRESEKQWRVECEHVEQVKSYAPGVMHYVLDISISPLG